jgi:hypothetical protein
MFGTYDFSDPMLSIPGGKVDCRHRDSALSKIMTVYWDKQHIVQEGHERASSVYPSVSWEDCSANNPYSKFFSPNKWTAFNTGYSYFSKTMTCASVE